MLSTKPYIVFEGLDKAGKTSMARRLDEHLAAQGIESIAVREPGGTPIGAQLRSLLLHSRREISPHTQNLMFAADHWEHMETVVRPNVKDKWIVSDRGIGSALAYGLARGAQHVGTLYDGTHIPDLNIYLSISPEVMQERMQTPRDNIEALGMDFMREVHIAYDRLARFSTLWGPWERIDAARELDDVWDDVNALIHEYWPEYSLWSS